MDTVRKKVIEQNEISEMHTFILGGKAQKVLIEGRKKELPVLLVLHGGPGTPIPMCAGGRGFPCHGNLFSAAYSGSIKQSKIHPSEPGSPPEIFYLPPESVAPPP